ncbi:hypothetical protein PR048_003026 [Dryococelus australis]|uniref:Uncharacterized protein n=1 Tax=Dryococelus australis TaxID=614101 RepID=A0ABQ9ILX0_9NEOP|nr:hypothetical protein PR048_003026 [Dryococelus australis]
MQGRRKPSNHIVWHDSHVRNAQDLPVKSRQISSLTPACENLEVIRPMFELGSPSDRRPAAGEPAVKWAAGRLDYWTKCIGRSRRDLSCGARMSHIGVASFRYTARCQSPRAPRLHLAHARCKLKSHARIVVLYPIERDHVYFNNTTRLPPRRTRFDSRRSHPWILATGNRAGRCRWSAGFLGDLPFPPPLHFSAAPHSLRFTLIEPQDLDTYCTSTRFTSIAVLYIYNILNTLNLLSKLPPTTRLQHLLQPPAAVNIWQTTSVTSGTARSCHCVAGRGSSTTTPVVHPFHKDSSKRSNSNENTVSLENTKTKHSTKRATCVNSQRNAPKITQYEGPAKSVVSPVSITSHRQDSTHRARRGPIRFYYDNKDSWKGEESGRNYEGRRRDSRRLEDRRGGSKARRRRQQLVRVRDLYHTTFPHVCLPSSYCLEDDCDVTLSDAATDTQMERGRGGAGTRQETSSLGTAPATPGRYVIRPECREALVAARYTAGASRQHPLYSTRKNGQQVADDVWSDHLPPIKVRWVRFPARSPGFWRAVQSNVRVLHVTIEYFIQFTIIPGMCDKHSLDVEENLELLPEPAAWFLKPKYDRRMQNNHHAVGLLPL